MLNGRSGCHRRESSGERRKTFRSRLGVSRNRLIQRRVGLLISLSVSLESERQNALPVSFALRGIGNVSGGFRSRKSPRQRWLDRGGGPGDAFFFGPGEAHQLANAGYEDFVYYVIADNPRGDSCFLSG